MATYYANQYFDPTPFDSPSQVVSTAIVIDATGEKAAFIFRAPYTGSITGITFRTVAVSSAQELTVSLQDVSTSTGFPDGTQDQTATVTPSANTNHAVVFGAARSVTRGELVACVIEFTSTAGNVQFAAIAHNSNTLSAFPRACLYTTSWAVSARAGLLSVNYGGTYYPIYGLYPAGNWTTVAYNSGSSTQDEYCLRTSCPVARSVVGISFHGSVSGDYDLTIYDSSGAAITNASVSVDKDYSGNLDCLHTHILANDISLAANTVYLVGVRPTSGSNVTLYYLQVETNAELGQISGGTGYYLRRRLDNSGVVAEGGNDTVIRPMIFLLVQPQDGSSNVIIIED